MKRNEAELGPNILIFKTYIAIYKTYINFSYIYDQVFQTYISIYKTYINSLNIYS